METQHSPRNKVADVAGADDDTLSKAINHPVGQVTDAAFKWWYRQGLNDGQLLQGNIRSIFSELCDLRRPQFRYGRVLLSVNVIALFRVDPEWSTQNILPLFNWDEFPNEALSCWKGFLWAPRLHIPLLTFLKKQFLACATHYEKLKDLGGQFAALLAYASLEAPASFSKKELATATANLPMDGLARTVQVLNQALEAAGDQRAEYWRNRISVYLRDIWPKSNELRTTAITTKLARLCIKSGDAFPEALEQLKHWLQPVGSTDLFHELVISKLAEKYPETSLAFLNAITGDASLWSAKELIDCLNAIRSAEPGLEADPRYQRLSSFARRFPLG